MFCSAKLWAIQPIPRTTAGYISPFNRSSTRTWWWAEVYCDNGRGLLLAPAMGILRYVPRGHILSSPGSQYSKFAARSAAHDVRLSGENRKPPRIPCRIVFRHAQERVVLPEPLSTTKSQTMSLIESLLQSGRPHKSIGRSRTGRGDAGVLRALERALHPDPEAMQTTKIRDSLLSIILTGLRCW